MIDHHVDHMAALHSRYDSRQTLQPAGSSNVQQSHSRTGVSSGSSQRTAGLTAARAPIVQRPEAGGAPAGGAASPNGHPRKSRDESGKDFASPVRQNRYHHPRVERLNVVMRRTYLERGWHALCDQQAAARRALRVVLRHQVGGQPCAVWVRGCAGGFERRAAVAG